MRPFLAWVLHPRLWIIVIVVAISALFVASAVVLPRIVADFDGVAGDARVQDIASVRQAVLWIGGGVLAALTLLFTWRRDTLTRDANFTGRYTEAIAQLGDDSIAIRLGGVYALERIARDSSRDRGTILDVLAAYLRHHSPAPTEDEPKRALTVDLAAAALVLGRITRMSPPVGRVELSRTNLRGANLRGANLALAHLVGADLSRANLNGATLTGAHMEKADLSVADLTDAILRSTRLLHANITGAKLVRTNLRAANLRRADLAHAYAVRALFLRANLTDANLSDVNLSGALLIGANLTRANLAGADITDADLSGTKIEGTRLARPEKGPSLTGEVGRMRP